MKSGCNEARTTAGLTTGGLRGYPDSYTSNILLDHQTARLAFPAYSWSIERLHLAMHPKYPAVGARNNPILPLSTKIDNTSCDYFTEFRIYKLCFFEAEDRSCFSLALELNATGKHETKKKDIGRLWISLDVFSFCLCRFGCTLCLSSIRSRSLLPTHAEALRKT